MKKLPGSSSPSVIAATNEVASIGRDDYSDNEGEKDEEFGVVSAIENVRKSGS